MPHYKLTYFDIRGLGEGARLIFKQAGVSFEDHRISHDEWPKMKPTTPFGQLPILEVDDHVIAQSAAIFRYLGNQFGLVPKCPLEAAEVDSMFDAHKDFMFEARPFFMVAFGYQQGDKEKTIKEAAVPARDKYFPALEKFLKKSGSGFLVGKKVSWADLVIADALSTYSEHWPHMFDGHPEIKKFVDHVNSLPNIKKWRAERPKSTY